jgi:2-polyprenyl-3-methyl-5-hydroxy-6-metoxy-1,4-benzoquinol methylase
VRAPSAEDVGRRVRTFYEGCSFPGYEEFDTPQALAERAGSGVYAHLLDEQVSLGARVLDAGCGTGQLTLFLSMLGRHVVGIDLSHASLTKGQRFNERFGLHAHFAQMDLFRPALREESFDYVFTNGVLHHTADASGGFRALLRLLKPGGIMVVGLYNTYGRLLLRLRKLVFRLTGNRALWLDGILRAPKVGEDKKRIWFLDQYAHPHERTFTVDDVLTWFRQTGVEYVSSIPPIRVGHRLTGAESLFTPRPPGTRVDHLVAQLLWVVSQSREGGFFNTIGRKL